VAIAAEYQAVAEEAGIAVAFCPNQDVPCGENNST